MSAGNRSTVVGISGAARNAAVALCDRGRIVGICEQERITRTRHQPLRRGRLPRETVHETLKLGGRSEGDISTYAVAESAIQLPDDRPVAYVDHHHAHAATAFYGSPFRSATVLVCDRHSNPELTIWQADERGVRPTDFNWVGPAYASLYSSAAEALGFARDGDEHRLEALARVGERRCNLMLPSIVFRDDHLDVPSQFQSCIAALLAGDAGNPIGLRASLAEQVQRMLGAVLLQLIEEIRKQFPNSNLCLGGGLFFNSYFNTLVAQAGLYDETFVPPNPGNAGVAAGAAMVVAAREGALVRDGAMSPFLGPEFSPVEIKATLDNCKLSYDYLHNGKLVDRTVGALAKGQLVGWFQGRMEWGARALGHRSILANPVAPYVLENLNVYLKHREPHRSYSVAICAEDLPRYFDGPARSSLMEYEYDVLDPDLLRGLLPANATRLRVQTVDESDGPFHGLIRAFGELTGIPMLVNTSFNGFNEPIVCNPRDAIRVFFGTGLDMAVLDSLMLQK